VSPKCQDMNLEGTQYRTVPRLRKTLSTHIMHTNYDSKKERDNVSHGMMIEEKSLGREASPKCAEVVRFVRSQIRFDLPSDSHHHVVFFPRIECVLFCTTSVSWFERDVDLFAHPSDPSTHRFIVASSSSVFVSFT
jgi:hypothetical protein